MHLCGFISQYPIGYVQHKNAFSKKASVNRYTAAGRAEIHDNLRINMELLLQLKQQPSHGRSTEYTDNRISLFSAQWGKCAITRREFKIVREIHCHHIILCKNGGTDKYENLILISDDVHRLLHAANKETIEHYKRICNLDKEQVAKLNKLRKMANLDEIA